MIELGPSQAYGCTSTGSLVVGSTIGDSSITATSWIGTTPTTLPGLTGSQYSQANACSADGSIVIGISQNSTFQQFGVFWFGGVLTSLVNMADGWSEEAITNANGCSADGSIIVGSTYGSVSSGPVWQYAVYWTSGGTVINLLPTIPSSSPTNPQANACSADGTIIVGSSFELIGSLGVQVALYWTVGETTTYTILPLIAGGAGGVARACSSDGSVIVGQCTDSTGNIHAVTWTAGTITVLPDLAAPSYSVAYGCSADGAVIVGGSEDIDGNTWPVMWKAGVITQLTDITDSTNPGVARGISRDASTIFGWGNDASSVLNALTWTPPPPPSPYSYPTPPTWTQQEFATAFLRLLPTGIAWPTYGNSQLVQSLYPLSAPYADNSELAAALLVDTFPATIGSQLDPEWMLSLGLPGPCGGSYPTIEAEQQAIVTQLTDKGGCSEAYFISVAAQFGFVVTVTNYMPLRVGMPIGSPMYGDDAAFVITMTITSGSPASLLYCEMARRLPAHMMLYVVDGDTLLSPPAILYPSVSVSLAAGIATFVIPTAYMQAASISYSGGVYSGTVIFLPGQTSRTVAMTGYTGAITLFSPVNVSLAG